MIIVGEKINTSLKGVTEFVRERNAEAIQELAVSQAELAARWLMRRWQRCPGWSKRFSRPSTGPAVLTARTRLR